MNDGIAQPQFGERLRALRRARGMSQRDLAQGAVSASYVSLLESGQRVPTPRVAADLASALGIGRSELTEGALPDADVAPAAPAAHVPEPAPERIPDDLDEHLVQRILTETAVTSGDTVLAQSWAEAAYKRAADEGSPEQIVESGLALNRVLSAANVLDRRAEVLDEIARVAEGTGLPQILTSIMIDQASVARELGELQRARTLIEGAAARMRSGRLLGTVEEVRLSSVRAAVLCDVGEAEAARDLLPELLKTASQLGEGAVIGRAEWVAALVCSRLDDPEALLHLEHARQALDSSMPVSDWLRFCRAAASIVLDVGGDVDQATELLQDGRAAQRAMRIKREKPALDVLEARIALARGDHARARELCETVLASDHGLAGFEMMRLHRTLVTAAEGLGELEVACQELRNLAAAAEREGLLQTALEAWKHLEELRGRDD